jgi:hypothetical protein
MQAQATLPTTSTATARTATGAVSVRGPEAAILTGCAAGIGVVFGVLLGPLAVLLYALTIPVPMVLLWLSADVRRSDER